MKTATELYSTATTLFLVKDPIGNIPIFLSLLRAVPPKRRSWLIIRENLIALIILTAFLLWGKPIFAKLHITQHALGLSGGIILFIVALKMAFPPELPSLPKERALDEPFIVPLAIPFLAGPSAIATVTLLANQHPDQMQNFLALVFVTALSTLILLFATPLQKLLGLKLLAAFERLMGIILIVIAIQMSLDGLYGWLKAF